jgi:hypothetical protein
MTNDALELHKHRPRVGRTDYMLGGEATDCHGLPWFTDCGEEGRKEGEGGGR